MEDGHRVLGIQLEYLVRYSSELGDERLDIDTFLAVLVGDDLEVLDAGFGDATFEVVVIAVSFRVPLRWVIDETVAVVEVLCVVYLLKHAVVLLQGLPLSGLACVLVDGWNKHFGLAKLPDAARNILVLHSEVLVSNTC